MYCAVRYPAINGLILTFLRYGQCCACQLCTCSCIDLADLDVRLLLLVLHCDNAVLGVLVFDQLAVLNCKCDRFSDLVAVRCTFLNKSVCAVCKAFDLM